MRLEDRSILHIEFQSSNDPDICYRQGIYCLMLSQRYRCDVEQVLIYVGRRRLTMEGRLRTGRTTVEFDVIDIRSLRAEDLINDGRPADLVLSMLAKGGAELLPEIVRRAGRLRGRARDRLLAQLLVFSGLRGLPGKVELEMNRMGVVIDIRKNPVLMRYLRDAKAEGIAEGREEGLAEGRVEGLAEGRVEGLAAGRRALLTEQLVEKFGPLEPWIVDRIARATVHQLDLWGRKLITASRLDQVIRRR
ncbi:MAG: hypothetical protein R2729_32755 [Bryobacteraceae bacterium]